MIKKEEPKPAFAVFIDKAGCPFDAVAEEIHNAWMEESARQGRVAPGTTNCPNCGRELEKNNYYDKSGRQELLLCRYCSKKYVEHSDMVPYKQLPESVKNYARVTAQAAAKALGKADNEDKMSSKAFTIIAAIVDQCGGKIIVEGKYMAHQEALQTVNVLDFKQNPTTEDLEIILYGDKKGSQP